jgi:hypothetical protein
MSPPSSGSKNKARNYLEAGSNEGSASAANADIIFINFTKIANNRDITIYSSVSESVLTYIRS